MTTLQRHRVACECGARFDSFHPCAWTMLDRDSDMRPHNLEDPLPYLIHTCPECSFTGGLAEFADQEAVEMLSPGMGPESPPAQTVHEIEGEQVAWPIVDLVNPPYREASRRFVKAALCREERGDSPRTIADYYLKASWAARSAGDHAFERKCQARAREQYRAMLAQSSGLSAGDSSMMQHLIGELSRRLGDFECAVQTFESLTGATPKPELNERLLEASRSAVSDNMTMSGEPDRTPQMPEDRARFQRMLQGLDAMVKAGRGPDPDPDGQ